MSKDMYQGTERARALSREEAQQANLRSLIAVVFVAAAAAWWHLGTSTEMDAALFFTCAGFTISLMVIYALSTTSLSLARAFFLGACVISLAIIVLDTRSAQIGYLFVLPVFAAGALVAPYAAPICAAACALLILAVVPEGAALLALTVSFMGICFWLVLRTLHDMLERYSRRSLEATYLAEQLRDQRGKLNRTIKDLDSSYQWLQQTNRELAIARQEADILRDLRNRFATNLSHELRTPLNIIIGFSQLIYLNPELYGYSKWSDLLLNDLSEIQRNAGYLSDLVSDIVDLARVDALAMPIRREPTCLRQVIQEAVETVNSLARKKGLHITVSCPDDLPPALIDRVRIRQVLFNLIANAIRYTDRGEVAVQARRIEDELMISVVDTGRGIPREELSTIFTEFYQVGQCKEDADAGKGLGLAIARRFIQLHGGRIWAESELGQGSTFSFTLPLSSKPASFLAQSAAAPLPKPRRKPVVLVLDEDGTAAGYLRRRLEDWEFLPVATAEELAAMVAAEAPVAVIVNRSLGSEEQSPGSDLLSHLPETMPLIECSLPTSQWLSREEQFAAVLTKPVSADSVLSVLARLLPPLENMRVLIVDDDHGFVQLLSRILQAEPRNQYQVLTAYSGEEALRKMTRVRPDVALIDLRMPDLSGFDVLARMRREPELRDVPVVAVTAATPGEDHLLAKGAAFCLRKRGAFQPGELVRLIAAGLGQVNGTAVGAPSTG
jgi:signal transduction histidine kinase/CheY-like chemotaxis protein